MNKNDIKTLELSSDNEKTYEDEKMKRLNSIVNHLYKDKDLLGDAVLGKWYEKNHFFGIALDFTKFTDEMMAKYDLDYLISNFEMPCCSVCGCHYYGDYLYTYRHGGRSYECISCSEKNQYAVNKINEIKNKKGKVAARKFLETLFITE